MRAAALAIALAAALTGCATTPAPQPVAAAAVPDPAATMREWAGRFSAVRQPADPAATSEAAHGRFELVSTPDPAAGVPALSLAVFSPFGQTIATASRAPTGVATVVLADGRQLHAYSLDELLHQALGYRLPVERLPQWLDGRFEQVLERDAAGQPRSAIDSGWRIELGDGRWALHRQEQGDRITVRLVLDR
jgi:outer membrane biogenesis lipoprotein LolB